MTQDKGKLMHAHPANELTEKLFGFESVVAKEKYADADATTFLLNSDAVPEGKIWKITFVAAWNLEGDISSSLIYYINHDATDLIFYVKVSATAASVPVAVATELFLDHEDYIIARFKLVGIGEECHLNIFGYEMNAP